MNTMMTADQIEKAVDTLISKRPAYKAILDFYGHLFIAQENSKHDILLAPILIPDKILSVKRNEKLPLISPMEFKIDVQAALELFGRIYLIARDTHPDMADSVRFMWDAMEKRHLDTKKLFTALLREDDAFFGKISQQLGANKQVLAFMTYSSLNPSITLCAEQLSTYLNKDEPWHEGYCPVCGAPPTISTLEDDGKRSMTCGFCWYAWSAPRIGCPFCSNTNEKKQYYFYSEEEKEYRVDVCDICGKYIKTIDKRKTDRLLYQPLEQISTLHLDIQAKEKGLKSINPSFPGDAIA